MPFFFIISPEIPQLIAILISTDPRQLVQYVPNHFFTPARKIISPNCLNFVKMCFLEMILRSNVWISMDTHRARDEIICSVKGYFQNERFWRYSKIINKRKKNKFKIKKYWLRSRSRPLNNLNHNSSVQCQLLLICQNGRWVINREETQESPTEPVSFLNESLEHSFFNSQGKDFREIWHVNWSVIEKRGKAPKNWAFRSFHAVEARSLDRGLRIVKNELKSSSPDAPEMRFF